MTSFPFQGFYQTADRVGATRKRLGKSAIPGAYFAGLSDDDLRLTAGYFAGGGASRSTTSELSASAASR